LFSAALPGRLPVVGGKRHIPEPMDVLSVKLPAELHERLKGAAKENERTVSQEVRYAIARHLDALKEEAGAPA
jgi:hypothetical protein